MTISFARRHWKKLSTLAILLSGLLIGCRSTITAPAFPDDPAEVFLLTDARHYGLILPDGPGQFVEFGFGDWEWYAQSNDAWYRAFPTVLWPTRSTLGRRKVAGVHGHDLARRFHWIQVHRLVVERAKVAALHDRLTAQFDSGSEGRIYNALYGFDFVPLEDEGYWMFWNCTDAIAAWLEALDCDVSWVPLRVGFIEDPQRIVTGK